MTKRILQSVLKELSLRNRQEDCTVENAGCVLFGTTELQNDCASYKIARENWG